MLFAEFAADVVGAHAAQASFREHKTVNQALFGSGRQLVEGAGLGAKILLEFSFGSNRRLTICNFQSHSFCFYGRVGALLANC
ncbi:hypothetical protein DZC52_00375 [Wenzhouxiangella sediminis]|uniref:Uncharacterized protein n=1 Tax=Wenzhouxiangella sediminis TaxID=1792836 RepID=A0A3E1KDY1_9GAMM|nr:hypothetical protein DZC52_00375 [Wenzhouxiangella sediminis]